MGGTGRPDGRRRWTGRSIDELEALEIQIVPHYLVQAVIDPVIPNSRANHSRFFNVWRRNVVVVRAMSTSRPSLPAVATHESSNLIPRAGGGNRRPPAYATHRSCPSAAASSSVMSDVRDCARIHARMIEVFIPENACGDEPHSRRHLRATAAVSYLVGWCHSPGGHYHSTAPWARCPIAAISAAPQTTRLEWL